MWLSPNIYSLLEWFYTKKYVDLHLDWKIITNFSVILQICLFVVWLIIHIWKICLCANKSLLLMCKYFIGIKYNLIYSFIKNKKIVMHCLSWFSSQKKIQAKHLSVKLRLSQYLLIQENFAYILFLTMKFSSFPKLSKYN